VTPGRGRGSKIGRRKGSPRGRGSKTSTRRRREGTERRDNWHKKRLASKLEEQKLAVEKARQFSEEGNENWKKVVLVGGSLPSWVLLVGTGFIVSSPSILKT
jgi:hypothetical protein